MPPTSGRSVDPGSGGLLASVAYNPDRPVEITTAEPTWRDVEPVELRARFTAPASGLVLVVVNAVARNSDTAVVHQWGLRGTGGGPEGLVPNSGRLMMAATTASIRKTYRHLAPVDPGAPIEWTFAFRAVPVGVAAILCGGELATPDAAEGYGPAQIEVWDT